MDDTGKGSLFFCRYGCMAGRSTFKAVLLVNISDFFDVIPNQGFAGRSLFLNEILLGIYIHPFLMTMAG